MKKRDFLKALGAGFGIAGLTLMMGTQSSADVEKKGKYVIVITHGGNDPNRAIFGLLMAQVAPDKGWGRVHVMILSLSAQRTLLHPRLMTLTGSGRSLPQMHCLTYTPWEVNLLLL